MTDSFAMHGADGSGLSRRAILHRGVWLAALAVAANGCRERRTSHSGSPDPDTAAVAAAVADEVRLLQLYDAAIAASRGRVAWLSEGRDAHAAHLSALTNRPQLVATPSASAAVAGAELPALATAERDSAAILRATAVAAHDGSRAALLASIAAAHAAHASLRPARAVTQ